MTAPRSALILVFILVAASAGIAYIGLFVMPRPGFPSASDLLDYPWELSDYNTATLVPRGIAQFGIGMLVGVPLAFSLAWKLSLKAQARGPRLRVVGTCVLGLGLAGFTVVGMSDLIYAHYANRESLAFAVLLFSDSIFGNHVGFSIMGSVLLLAATVGAAFLISPTRLLDGLRTSFMLVAAPAVVVFTLGVWYFDNKEMAIHATNFLVGLSLNHTDLVSNWTALTASTVVMSAGVSLMVSRLPENRRIGPLL